MKLHVSVAAMSLSILSSGAFAQTVKTISLREAVAIAVERNPQSNISRRTIDAQRGQFWRNISLPPPVVTVNYAFIPAGRSLDQFSERTIELAQSFDFPTTMFLRASQATSEVSAAEMEYASTVNDLALRVKTAYWNSLAKQMKLVLAKENQAIAEDFARKSAVRRGVGEGTHLELLTANVQRTQAANAVQTDENDLRIAMNELKLLLGMGQDASRLELILTDSMVYRPDGRALEDYLELVKTSNSELRASGFRRDVASKSYSLAWSSLLPSFSASYLWQTRDGISGLYGVTLGMSVPLWFLFDQRGQIQTASAGLAIAEHELRFTEDSVTVAVRSAYYEKLNSERELRLYQAEILPQADEILRAAKTSYDAGEITYLEFLQARQTVLQARNTYVDVLYAFNAAQARLDQIAGRQPE